LKVPRMTGAETGPKRETQVYTRSGCSAGLAKRELWGGTERINGRKDKGLSEREKRQRRDPSRRLNLKIVL